MDIFKILGTGIKFNNASIASKPEKASSSSLPIVSNVLSPELDFFNDGKDAEIKTLKTLNQDQEVNDQGNSFINILISRGKSGIGK